MKQFLPITALLALMLVGCNNPNEPELPDGLKKQTITHYDAAIEDGKIVFGSVDPYFVEIIEYGIDGKRTTYTNMEYDYPSYDENGNGVGKIKLKSKEVQLINENDIPYDRKTYNASGNLICESDVEIDDHTVTTYYCEDIFYDKTVEVFNDDWKCIHYAAYCTSDGDYYTIDYKFDSKGRTIEEKQDSYGSGELVSYVSKYRYSGNKMYVETVSSTGGKHTIVETYDKHGNIISYETQSIYGSMKEAYEYTYNSKGLPTKCVLHVTEDYEEHSEYARIYTYEYEFYE